MRKTTYTDWAHTATTTQLPADASQATNGLPNRLMTAFEVAEFIGCHEETVRRAYLRGLLVPRLDSSRSPKRECRNQKEDPYGCSKTVSQQRLQDEPSLRAPVVAAQSNVSQRELRRDAEDAEQARGRETLLLLSHGIEPAARARGQRRLEREALAKINLHWHDLRHEALSRLADDGVHVQVG